MSGAEVALKPCPFCGVRVDVRTRQIAKKTWWSIQHPPSDCFIQEGADVIFESAEELAAAWNTRTQENQHD